MKKTLMMSGLMLMAGLAAVGCGNRTIISTTNTTNISDAPGYTYGRPTAPVVKPGVEVLFENPEYLNLIKGKRVGLVTNPTGVDTNLNSTIDLLHEHPDVELVKLFAPEHGVRGDAYAGEKVKNQIDAKTGAEVISLYGSSRRPSEEQLSGLDVVIYDIQDIGSRSYTYVYTMSYVMMECAKYDIPFIVLDRPNPCGAHYTDGNVLNVEDGTTFVGLYPIPYMYGLTPGEAAMLFNGEFHEKPADLTVVKMTGYKRDMVQDDTGIPFVPTSTHIPHGIHGLYYNLTGILGEIRKVSIGVGYTLPFEVVAAPYIDPHELTAELREHPMPGIKLRPISFRPSYGAYKGEMIHGTHFIITDPQAVRPVTAQMYMIAAIQKLYPEAGVLSDEVAGPTLFDEVMGEKRIRKQLLEGLTADEIMADWPAQREEFELIRTKYLIYP